MLLEGDEEDTMWRIRAALTTRVTYEETAPSMDDVTAEVVAGDIGRLLSRSRRSSRAINRRPAAVGQDGVRSLGRRGRPM
jgi:hypothetical protein